VAWGDSSESFVITLMTTGLLPIMTFYMSYKFDLVSMSDGYSSFSHFVWNTLGLILSLIIIYALVFK